MKIKGVDVELKKKKKNPKNHSLIYTRFDEYLPACCRLTS